jgi:hypothetical protein
MILLLVAVGKQICRADVPMDEHRCTCEDLAHLCDAVNQVHGIPMDVAHPQKGIWSLYNYRLS